MWYNSQAVRKEGSEWSLKIEQQEISTKHCEVRNTKSRQRELYILNKVKEAKIKIARKGYSRSGRIGDNRKFFESLILAQDERWRRA